MAARLLAHERRDGTAVDTSAARVLHERLTRRLSPLIGAAGVAALFARSVAITRTHTSGWRDPTTPTIGHPLAFLDDLPADAREPAAVSVFAAFLALLASFIGERLTAELLRRDFPAIDSPPEEGT